MFYDSKSKCLKAEIYDKDSPQQGPISISFFDAIKGNQKNNPYNYPA